ncbi:MAG: CDGSH iron-sulfur domain-containing protein [Proteobacteria bacterium]|nr:CDGSH iron-sulfur domain-containing protein [Pseudomonadota bacterium]MBI3497427.1 CDGSH iron-sulfur domain-containing protein [Pseudomonadota bacterium]
MSSAVDVVIAKKKPYYYELEAGKTYFWCACGRSRTQPFCDGSHKGTDYRPIAYKAEQQGEEVLFCGCKHSKTKPFCDGAHNNLSATYEEDDPNSAQNRAIPTIDADKDGKALLDGGCYVCTIPAASLERRGVLSHRPVINKQDGALHQSLYYFECARGHSPIVGFGNRHVILFVSEGEGELVIGERAFAVSPNTGVYVCPGEGFQFCNAKDVLLKVFAAACPSADGVLWHEAMPAYFDAAKPRRTIGIDPDGRNRMGDRFFQMLVDKTLGSTVVTQFIGEIPKSKAAPHRHLYEESLIIMSGSGAMWTEARKAPVRAGDVIFLPRKQIHSLECTDPAGMLVAGVIYPGDNPSINY